MSVPSLHCRFDDPFYIDTSSNSDWEFITRSLRWSFTRRECVGQRVLVVPPSIRNFRPIDIWSYRRREVNDKLCGIGEVHYIFIKSKTHFIFPCRSVHKCKDGSVVGSRDLW